MTIKFNIQLHKTIFTSLGLLLFASFAQMVLFFIQNKFLFLLG